MCIGDAGKAAVVLIGEFATRTGLSQRTVRHYEERKVLQASGRSESGYRFYTTGDVDRAHAVRIMRALALTTTEIRSALETLDLVESDAETSMTTIRRALTELVVDFERRESELREKTEIARDFVTMLRAL